MARLPAPDYATTYGTAGFTGPFETEGLTGSFAQILEARANAVYNAIGMQPPIGPSGCTGGASPWDGGGPGGGGTGGTGESGGGGGGTSGGSGGGVVGGQNPGAFTTGMALTGTICSRCQNGALGGHGMDLGGTQNMSRCDLNSCFGSLLFQFVHFLGCRKCIEGVWRNVIDRIWTETVSS